MLHISHHNKLVDFNSKTDKHAHPNPYILRIPCQTNERNDHNALCFWSIYRVHYVPCNYLGRNFGHSGRDNDEINRCKEEKEEWSLQCQCPLKCLIRQKIRYMVIKGTNGSNQHVNKHVNNWCAAHCVSHCIC